MDTTSPEVVTNPFATAMYEQPNTALAEATVQHEVAEVQAALVIAKRFPRDPVQAVDRILHACTRPKLAQTALYQYARGGTDISGPSIRLAEAIAQQWGNIVCGVSEIVRRSGESECVAYAWDLETNFRDDRHFVVKHVRQTRNGTYALTDERDLYEAIANQGARRKRACLLTVIPGDVVEAAVNQIDVTLRTHVDITPERIKNMLEMFNTKYNITKEMIEARIQRRIDAVTPALFVQLGRIANSLQDGMSVPSDWFEFPQQAQQEVSESAQKIKDKLAERQHARDGLDEGGEQAPAPTLPEFLVVLENRLALEHRRHEGGLPEPWKTWEVDLPALKALDPESEAAQQIAPRLADALNMD